MTSSLTIKKVDYSDSAQITILLELLQMYAKDPMGGGCSIPDPTLNLLPKALKDRPFMHSFLVFNEQNKAVGFANCIESFSTFAAKSVLNIHDFAVLTSERNKGVSQFLLNGISDFAISINCCKLTLEVLEGNKAAIAAYKASGFKAYELDPEMGKAIFFQRYL